MFLNDYNNNYYNMSFIVLKCRALLLLVYDKSVVTIVTQKSSRLGMESYKI